MECYYFGTFNPPHSGHIKIANEVLKKFNFSKIVFVPANCPPHKNNAANPMHRLNMLRLVESDKIKVSDIEFSLPTPSFSYQTIEAILKNNQQEKLNFIIGFDAFKNIEKWKNPEILKKKLFFIVLKRKGENREEIEKLKNKGFNFVIADNIEEYDVSSTEIRKKVFEGENIEGFVDEKIRRYIYENGLYRKNS